MKSATSTHGISELLLVYMCRHTLYSFRQKKQQQIEIDKEKY